MGTSAVRRHLYSPDLTDAQWEVISPLLPPPKRRGRPREVKLRTVIAGILFLNRSGCQWRLLPKQFAPWQTVYGYFRHWRRDGTWERIHTRLPERVREKANRKATPSAAIIDSQSVKTSEKGGFAVTMPARRSTGGNATSLSTPWGWSWPSSSMPPAFRTEMAPSWCWPDSRP